MKILCIDGGGIRGVLAVALLAEAEQDLGVPLKEMIDMIAGTSTGSIIASTIAVGNPMSRLLEGYIQHGKNIFKRKAKLGLFRSIYSDNHLRNYIREEFKGLRLVDLDLPTIIPAVNVRTGEPYVHRSYQSGGKESEFPLWEAIIASCSAPIFFPPTMVNRELVAIDGGLWANNPSLVAITEAKRYFHQPLEHIQILSIGLGKQKINFADRKAHLWGIESWMPFHLRSLTFTPKLVDLALHLSSESVSYQCHELLEESYLRINAPLGKEVSFDEVKETHWLVELGRETYWKHQSSIKQFFLKAVF